MMRIMRCRSRMIRGTEKEHHEHRSGKDPVQPLWLLYGNQQANQREDRVSGRPLPSQRTRVLEAEALPPHRGLEGRHAASCL